MKVFVPFSETLVKETGLELGHLVPFKLEYECLRLYGWESVEILEPWPEQPAEAELQRH